MVAIYHWRNLIFILVQSQFKQAYVANTHITIIKKLCKTFAKETKKKIFKKDPSFAELMVDPKTLQLFQSQGT